MPTTRDITNILVIKMRQLGDVLLTIPTFKALRQHFPAARLTALVNAGTEDMLAGHPAVDDILIFDRRRRGAGLWQRGRAEWRLFREIRRRRFDLVVDLTGSDRAAFLARASGARWRLGSSLCYGGARGKRRLFTQVVEFAPGWHVVQQNLAVVRQFGVAASDLRVDRPLTAAAQATVSAWLEQQGWPAAAPFIHVHPTSPWLFKCWPAEAVAAVIAWLLDQGLRVVLTAAPNTKELAKIEEILAALGDTGRRRPNFLNLAGRTGLMELAALTARARLFLGVDTMPMHLAAAMGTPVLALFGPSRVWSWAPWSPELAAFTTPADYYRCWHQGAFHLGPHLVIQRRWDCVPCNRDGCQGSKISRCLEDITVAEVQQAVTLMLQRPRPR